MIVGGTFEGGPQNLPIKVELLESPSRICISQHGESEKPVVLIKTTNRHQLTSRASKRQLEEPSMSKDTKLRRIALPGLSAIV